MTARSDVGFLSNILVRPYDIRASYALMYFPEANVLAPTTIDPASKTPAFQCVLVTVNPDGAETTAEQATTRRPLEMIKA